MPFSSNEIFIPFIKSTSPFPTILQRERGKHKKKGGFTMEKNKEIKVADMTDARELTAQLEKLPEAVRIKILYMIEGARLVSEQKAG